jgi:hypothetical protein
LDGTVVAAQTIAERRSAARSHRAFCVRPRRRVAVQFACSHATAGNGAILGLRTYNNNLCRPEGFERLPPRFVACSHSLAMLRQFLTPARLSDYFLRLTCAPADFGLASITRDGARGVQSAFAAWKFPRTSSSGGSTAAVSGTKAVLQPPATSVATSQPNPGMAARVTRGGPGGVFHVAVE